MKKLISIALIFTQLISGMTVTDPTSYTYYMQQLKAFNDQVKSSLDQLESLNKLNEVANQANKLIDDTGKLIYNPASKIQGIYTNLLNTVDRFQGVAERVQNIGVEHFLKNYHNKNEPLKGKEWENWKENFEALFDNSKDKKYLELNEKVNEAIQSDNFEAYQLTTKNLTEYLKLKELEKNQLKKEALLAPASYYNEYFLNDEVVSKREEKAKNIEALIKQIDSATDMYKQQQTTNQILIEILDIAMQQYEMQMKFFYALNITQLGSDNMNYDMQKVRKSRMKFENGAEKFSFSTNEYVNELIKAGENSSIAERLNGRIR